MMLLLDEFFRVVWLIMLFFLGTWFSVIRRAIFSEVKEAEQAVPREIVYSIYDKFPCGDQYQRSKPASYHSALHISRDKIPLELSRPACRKVSCILVDGDSLLIFGLFQ
jgi:hypothetical protein